VLSKALWIACLVAQGAVLLRLLFAGLVRRGFPFFSAYLTWGIFSGLLLVWIPYTSKSYAHAWLVVEPVFILLGFGTLWECYRRAVAPYQRGDRYFVLALAGTLSFTFALFSLSLELHTLTRITSYFWVILFDRMESTGTALFLGGLWLVFRQFPIARGSNTSLHWRLLLFFGLQNSAAFMVIAISSGRLVDLGNVISQASSLVLYILWAWNLSAGGEIEPVRPPIDLDETGFEPKPPIARGTVGILKPETGKHS